jgi:hypothetical protein
MFGQSSSYKKSAPIYPPSYMLIVVPHSYQYDFFVFLDPKGNTEKREIAKQVEKKI